MKNWQSSLVLDVVAFCCGLILPLAFAPYEIFPIAVISSAFLMALCINSSPKRALWRGYLFGLGFFGLGVYWVFISIHTFGDVPIPLAIIITAGLVMAMSCFTALPAYLFNRLQTKDSLKLICAFPALWVLLEWVRSWLCTGFPWLLLGSSQTNSPLKGYAPIFSVYGVSLAVLITAGCFTNAVIAMRKKEYRNSYLSLLAVVFIWSAGSALNFIAWTTPKGPAIPVSLVQGNIPQSIKWDPEHLQLSLDRYQDLTLPLLNKPGQIIIWPEAAVPIPMHSAAEYINGLDELARQHHVNLILGIPILDPNSKEYLNTIISLGPERRIYAKRHLVPFGEYTPFVKYLSNLLRFMDIPMSDLIPGKMKQDAFTINGVNILANICYEIAFPELIRTTDPNIGFLLTLTNDAWFGKSAASAQHLQMAQMRALELGRAVIMVGNDGITAIIGPDGNVKAVAPKREIYVLQSAIQPMEGLTPWMKSGMDPVLILMLSMLFIAVRSGIRNRFLQKNTANTVLENKILKTNEEHTS